MHGHTTACSVVLVGLAPEVIGRSFVLLSRESGWRHATTESVGSGAGERA